MGKKIVFIKDLPKDVNFDKFLPDAVEKPLFKMVFWSRKEDEARQQLAIDTQRNQLYELQHINTSKTRSWLLDNDVHKDGSLVMITPMDPLFVLLFATWTIEKDHYKTIYDLLTQVKALWWLELNHHAEMIRQICDIQRGTEDEMPENQYIKPNETKISTWLETKIDKVAKVLSAQAKRHADRQAMTAIDARFILPDTNSTTTTCGTTSLSNTKSSSIRDDNADLMLQKKQAVQILCEYVPDEWKQRLYTEYKIDLETVTPKKSNSKSVYHHEQQVTATSTSCSSSSTEEALDTSIHRFDIRHQQENKRPLNTKHLSNSDTTQKSNNKKSKLANVDRTGMKSLMSFFGKK